MKKYIILTLLSVFLGVGMAKIIFMGYGSDLEVFKMSPKYYFIQVGAYTTYESMIDNSSKVGNYIYMQDDLFYVYTCITKDMENISKIENYYKSIGIDIYIKEFNIEDNELYESVSTTDNIMHNTDEGIEELCKSSIAKYKEG